MARRSVALGIVPVLALAITATVPAIPPTIAASADDVAASRPAPVVIETTDPSVDPDSPAVRAEVQSIRDQRDDAIPGPPPQLRAALAGGISVNYVQQPPADVRAVVDRAVADWDAKLITDPGGPVVIDFYWEPLTPGLLGFAGPTSIEQGGGLPGTEWYPVALANTILGIDRAPFGPEIEVTLASNLYQSPGGWHVDAGPSSVPPGSRDLYSTIVHEIAHGLGFLGSATNGQLESPPFIYDTLAYHQGTRLVDLPDPGPALRSGNLFIDVSGGRLHELYAPGIFFNGSSFSHFDEGITTGEPGVMMTPALMTGESARVIDSAILGVLAGIGWQVTERAVAPAITGVSGSSGQVTVSWEPDLAQEGLPPTFYSVTAERNGLVEASATVPWQTTSTDLAGLTNFEDYLITITPSAANGAGPPVDRYAVGDPYLVTTSGTGLSRTVTWTAPDGPGTSNPTYTVERRQLGGNYAALATTSGTGIVDNGLSTGVYQYRVQATTGQGTTGFGHSIIDGVTSGVIRPMPLDGQVGRLYEAYFDRLPDSGGMAFWLGERASGSALAAISDGFAASGEFVATYGSLSNEQFVDLVYQNVLGRSPDAGGRAFWIGQLSAGVTRGSMMIGFSESPEFVTLTGTAAPQTSLEGSVFRLYLAYFFREPDTGGLAFWTSQAAAGQSLGAISSQFAASPEFTELYGSVSSDRFVVLVYQNVLGRQPDAAGRSYWTNQLASGVPRGEVMVGFSDATEYIETTGTIP